MTERILIREEPVPNTRLTAQWWETGPGQVELVVQRPPCGEVRDRPFRWLLSDSEIKLLQRHLDGDKEVTAYATRLIRDLIDSLLVGVHLMREKGGNEPEETNQ